MLVLVLEVGSVLLVASFGPCACIGSGSGSLSAASVRLVSKPFAFVGFLILVRLLPEYEFGVWVLYMTLVSFAEMGRSGLLQNAVVHPCPTLA